MSYDKQKIIDIALSEIGYLEKASNSQLDSKTANAGKENYTKYARDLATYPFYNGRKFGVAWCDVFVDWCFDKAFGKDAALALTFQPTTPSKNCGAGCKFSRDYYKAKGRLFNSPETGDQIFFYGSDMVSISHTGLVYKVDSTTVYTVEGNTSGASGVISNGGGVCKKSYPLSYARIAGYGRPDWGMPASTQNTPANTIVTEDIVEDREGEKAAENSSQEGKTVNISLSVLRRGSSGNQVKTIQKLLIVNGYDLGKYGADGVFGSATEKAVKAFQKNKGLDDDGIVGKLTWTALLK